MAAAPETPDLRIVKVRLVRNIEVDKRQRDRWIGGITPGGRQQSFVLGEVAGSYQRRAKEVKPGGLQQHPGLVRSRLEGCRAGARRLIIPLIPVTIGQQTREGTAIRQEPSRRR